MFGFLRNLVDLFKSIFIQDHDAVISNDKKINFFMSDQDVTDFNRFLRLYRIDTDTSKLEIFGEIVEIIRGCLKNGNERIVHYLLLYFKNEHIYLDWKYELRHQIEFFELCMMHDESFAMKLVKYIPEIFIDDCLVKASYYGKFNIFKHIVEKTNGNILYKQGLPMRIAVKGFAKYKNTLPVERCKHFDIIRYCIEKRGCPPYICAYDALKSACKLGLVEIVKYFIEECKCPTNFQNNYLFKCTTDEGIKTYLLRRTRPLASE